MTRRATIAGLGAVSATLALLAAPAPASSSAREPPCGTAGATVLADAVGTVAQRIYAAEVNSSEVSSDKRQIEGYEPLLSAVESGDDAAVEAAVHSLVYSHTHIVRLRVDRGAELLSDIGGPYILAPVTGTLRAHRRTIGHFVFSVQDDLGYVKLVTRFIGVPLVLRTDAGQVPVEGLLSPGPATIPNLGAVSYDGVAYEAYSFNARAYPSGRLRVSLLVPVRRALGTQRCATVKADELGLVAERISRRFELSQASLPPYIRLVQTMTHALVYVRAGTRTLAGSTRVTPAKLPSTGSVRWRGVEYEVSSFDAPSSTGALHVFVLVAR
jgi:hypothetical protein